MSGGLSEATFRDGPLPSRAALQAAVLLATPRPDCRRGGFAFASDAWVGQGSGIAARHGGASGPNEESFIILVTGLSRAVQADQAVGGSRASETLVEMLYTRKPPEYCIPARFKVP